MRRRDFITLVGGGAVAWPIVAHAQQAAMPAIGFLHSGSPEPNARRLAGFRKGLSDAGLVEGKNVAIEFRWAQGKDDRLPELEAALIRQRVAVIATLSSTTAAVATKAATSTIPIYFLIANPPDMAAQHRILDRAHPVWFDARQLLRTRCVPSPLWGGVRGGGGCCFAG